MDIATLELIQQRVLWLATRMIDHANRERASSPVPPGRDDEFALKVGGHQASSASIVSVMTSLWFGHLTGNDKVAVKPHASPVFHAIKYLMGELDKSYLFKLREFGGLQSYPSRTKDPDVFDFSTGSVGLGAVAPLFASAVRRYVASHFGDQPASRFIALVGDAELDEGNVWEAISDPALQGLGSVMWVIDVNRQSLDRVVPDQKIKRLIQFFGDSGWHVVEAKYGRRLQSAFAQPGGDLLKKFIDEMSNEEYQSLFSLKGSDLRAKFLENAPDELRRFISNISDNALAPLIQNLGGHDLGVLLDAYQQCDAVTDRPSVVFAYTVKGWGLPIAGDPMNHAAMLSATQIDSFRSTLGLTPENEWDKFEPGTAAHDMCVRTGGEINNTPLKPRPALTIPDSLGVVIGNKAVSTQEIFGRLLAGLDAFPALAERVVTTSPDVSVSTNLGGWINKSGVYNHEEKPDFIGPDRLLRWHEGPTGRHIELGISEMNLFLMLHALGLSHELHGEHLLPIGTVYDPFVCRGLDALIYALYNGARFIVAGTPSGVTLAPEGGAHQSTVTASLGMELPGIVALEPCYARALDWQLCEALRQLATHDGRAAYLRLSTRAIDQSPFTVALERLGEDTLKTHVLSGGYRLVEPNGSADVVLVASGAVVPEAVHAARLLEHEGVNAAVVDLTSSDIVYSQWRQSLAHATRHGQLPNDDIHLANLVLPAERHAPIVTIHDAASHTLAWLGSVYGTRVVPVGVDSFGQSGALVDLYRSFGLLPEQLVNAALVALG